MTSIEIAHGAKLKPITRLVGEKLGIEEGEVEPYGHFKAKLSLDYLETLKQRQGSGEIPLRDYAGHAQELKESYPLLGLPLSLWVE